MTIAQARAAKRAARSPSVMDDTRMDTALALTPAVRGRNGAAEHRVEVSPVAKRPNRISFPANVTAGGGVMSLAELTATVRTLGSREQSKLQ